MKSIRFLLRTIFLPVLLFLGACCCEKDVVVAPEAPPPPPAVVPGMGDVFFEFDKSDLQMDAVDQLKVNANWLMANPDKAIVIEGHCDERGTNEYNMALGDRRASSAKDYLVNLGVDPARIKTVSFGEERPFALGSNEEAWSQNRRAHFVVE